MEPLVAPGQEGFALAGGLATAIQRRKVLVSDPQDAGFGQHFDLDPVAQAVLAHRPMGGVLIVAG